MFTFVEAYTFDWPVTVRYPGAAGEEARGFTARFALLPEEDLLARAGGGDPAAALEAERAFLARALVGWTGILLPDGQPLAFSPEARDRLLAQRPVRMGVTEAYVEAVYRGNLRAGNSAPSPAPSGARRRREG